MISSSIVYAIVLIVSIAVLKQFEFARAWQMTISLSPIIPVAFVILASMRLMISSDERQQRIQRFAISFSAALMGLITFSYGFLENVGLRIFPTFFVLPMMILIWGMSLRSFEKRYP